MTDSTHDGLNYAETVRLRLLIVGLTAGMGVLITALVNLEKLTRFDIVCISVLATLCFGFLVWLVLMPIKTREQPDDGETAPAKDN